MIQDLDLLKTPDYQQKLAQLTKASLAEVLKLENDDLSWSLWNVDQPAKAV